MEETAGGIVCLCVRSQAKGKPWREGRVWREEERSGE